MTTDRQLDDTISRWFEAEAPMQLPDRMLRATFERTRRTRQQVGWRAFLGRLGVNRMFAALAGVAAVAVLALVAVGLYFNQPGGIGGVPPTPTQALSPTAAPSATAEPTATSAPTSTPGANLPEGPFDLEDNRMAMTVTIPASGWTFDRQFSALVKGREVANLPEAAILFWSFPVGTEFYVPGDPCQVTSTRPDTPATTVDHLATALAAQASRDASEPVAVMVGGYAGKSVTLHVPDDAVVTLPVPDDAWFEECEEGEFVSYGSQQDPLGRYHQGPGQIDELWILEVDGAIVIIDAMYRPDTAPELVEEMRTIAESATFGTP